jgi:hypothetical protein
MLSRLPITWLILRFWAAPHNSMDACLMTWRDVQAERALSKLQVLDPGFPRVDPPPDPGRPAPSFPTDVPAPEPHDVPVPEPIDVPPPKPGDKPPAKGTQSPKKDSKPRRVP